MDRREFVRLAGSGMAAGALAETLVSAQVARTPAAAKTNAAASKVKFKVGTQHGDDDATLKAMAAFGVNNICGSMPSAKLDEKWSVEALTKHREHVESFGIKLDMTAITMTSALDRSRADARHHAGAEPGARSQHRRHLHADPQLREGRHLPGEVQLHDPRHSAVGPGQRARPVDLQRVRPREGSRTRTSRRSPAKSAPTSTGSASRTSSSGSCRSPRNTR